MARETALHGLGITLNTEPENNFFNDVSAFSQSASAFSAYGDYTPITVSSETLKRDAIMERDK